MSSVLCIQIPFASAGGPDEPGCVPPPGPDVSILVVDDDDDVRDSLTWLLENEGYRVHTAPHGREALDLLNRIDLPDLALVDLRMPIMDGRELIEALRGDPRYAALPVVAFSAAATIVPPYGVPLLKKPIAIDELLCAIDANTPRRLS